MRSEGSWLSILGIDAPRKEELSLQIGLTKSLLRPSELTSLFEGSLGCSARVGLDSHANIF